MAIAVLEDNMITNKYDKIRNVSTYIHYEDDRGYFEFEMKNGNQGDVPLPGCL